MRRLNSLTASVNWDSFWEAMKALYPSQIVSRGAYKKAFKELQTIQPKLNSCTLIIKESPNALQRSSNTPQFSTMDLDMDPDVEDIDSYHHVYIADLGLETRPDYSMLYMDWAEALGLFVPESFASRFGDAGILAHAVYEITFVGFSRLTCTRKRMALVREYKNRIKDRHHRLYCAVKKPTTDRYQGGRVKKSLTF